MPRKASWKKPSDVKRVTFSRDKSGKLVRIGGSFVGSIYVGRLFFNGGRAQRVAIKRFNYGVTDEQAMKYQRVIDDLRESGVRLPKTAMLRIPTKEKPEGEWILVSQLFGSSKGSKIAEKSFLEVATPKGREEAAAELTKIANAGYSPAGDVIEPFKNPSKGVIAIDLDGLVFGAKLPAEKRAAALKLKLRSLAFPVEGMKPNPGRGREYRRLLAAALKTASPEIRRYLIE